MRMVYPVLCTAGCYVTVSTLFIKKVGVVRPIFFFFGGGGSGLPDPSVVAPLMMMVVLSLKRMKTGTSALANKSAEIGSGEWQPKDDFWHKYFTM